MASATSICSPWHPVHPAGGSGDVLPGHYAVHSKLSDDPIYRKRLEEGLVERAVKSRLKSNPVQKRPSGCSAGRSWRCYLCNHQQPKHGSGEKPLMNTTNAILIIMLSVAIWPPLSVKSIPTTSSTPAPSSRYERLYLYPGCCVAGRYFRSNNIDWIKDTAGEVIQGHPCCWPSSSSLLLLCCTLRLQPKSTDADGSGTERFSSDRCCFFAAVSGLFILPTYPTLVAADRWMTRVLPVSVNSSSTIRSHPGYSGCCPGRLLRLRAG